MKNIIFAMKDLFKNYFNWHGRLSRAGYLWSWAGILAINAGLIIIRIAVLFLVFFLYSQDGKHELQSAQRYWPFIASSDKSISELLTYAVRIWNIIIFSPILFATIRRYHDSGKAGWKAIFFNLLSPVFIASGLFIGSIVFIAFVFGGGYMVTADTDVPMAGLLSYTALSVFLLLAGAGFGILNLIYIFRRSDPEENKYGKPIPFQTFHP